MAAIRPVHFQRLIRVFEQDGFRFDRQVGDHLIYVRAGVRRPLVIPNRAVPVFIVENLLRTSGTSRERYFELLNESQRAKISGPASCRFGRSNSNPSRIGAEIISRAVVFRSCP